MDVNEIRDLIVNITDLEYVMLKGYEIEVMYSNHRYTFDTMIEVEKFLKRL